ncbi:MAG: hypothetical protein P0Y49_10755 [Candidatus Pedobacter colombiensis]|uniref:Uncharacterized protein n=1 Tax=Candidatus Pedobacter colombiensis TaxID=3121371 RepID=A0AAJ6B9M3_9SPHI|nr:hypothetical protein [Pedobacter sp.]WEK21616.1 MAG: hypothetical protein P0Y49_10755 [Pedobacter sp.]
MTHISFAQNSNRQAVIDNIRKEYMDNSKTDLLKDSIALYTFAIQIAVKKVKDSSIVTSIVVNDSIANTILPDHNFLRKINYAVFMSKVKRATIVIPFGFIVAHYHAKTWPERKITIDDLGSKIYKLFNYDLQKDTPTESFIYLSPFVTYADKSVYD